MLIKFKLDKDSIIKLYSENLVKTNSYNKIIMLVFIYILCVLGLIFTLTDKIDFRIGTTVMGIITIIFMKPLGKIVYRFTFSKVFNKEAYNYLFKDTTISIESENIKIVNTMEERNINFNSVKSINLFEEYLFIVLSNKKHLIISLSAFNNINQKDIFINLLEEKTGIKVKNLYPEKLVYM